MKYFTVELLNRFRSDNEDTSAIAHDEWEAALSRYRQREERIKPGLPKGVRRFLDARVCLHDARLLNMGKRDNTFVMILEKAPPLREMVILTFTLEGELRMTETTLQGKSPADAATWMYEEWNIDRRHRGRFAVLLSTGWTVELSFRDFDYLIVQQVSPNQNGQAAHSRTAIPRSA